MRNRYFALVAMFALLAGCSSEKGDSPEDGVEGTFRLHSFLQDGMVIQQNQPFRLWGKASAAHVKITAKPSWTRQEYTCKADASGTWVLEIPVPAAPSDGAPQSIRLSTPLQTTSLRDLLIGEVWVLGGQSNMAFALGQALDAPAEISAANYPSIRFFTVQPSNEAGRSSTGARRCPNPTANGTRRVLRRPGPERRGLLFRTDAPPGTGRARRAGQHLLRRRHGAGLYAARGPQSRQPAEDDFRRPVCGQSQYGRAGASCRALQQHGPSVAAAVGPAAWCGIRARATGATTISIPC